MISTACQQSSHRIPAATGRCLTSDAGVDDLVHAAYQLDRLGKSSSIPAHVSNHDLATGASLGVPDPVQVAHVQSRGLLEEDVLLMLEREDGLIRVVRVAAGDHDDVHLGRRAQLRGVLGRARDDAADHLVPAVLQSRLRRIAQIRDAEVVREEPQGRDVRDLRYLAAADQAHADNVACRSHWVADSVARLVFLLVPKLEWALARLCQEICRIKVEMCCRD